jgi:hypothetical protein
MKYGADLLEEADTELGRAADALRPQEWEIELVGGDDVREAAAEVIQLVTRQREAEIAESSMGRLDSSAVEKRKKQPRLKRRSRSSSARHGPRSGSASSKSGRSKLRPAPALRRRPVLEPVSVEQVVPRCRLEHQQLELAAVAELSCLRDHCRLRPPWPDLSHSSPPSEVVMAAPSERRPTEQSPDSDESDAEARKSALDV